MTIGILDSGLGGYSVYRALRAVYPDAAFLFLADQANAPFGDKTKAQIFEITQNAIEWFRARDIKELLVACNTISAQVLDDLIPLYPDMTITGIIEPTVRQIKLPHEKILVLATVGATRSEAYPKRIAAMLPSSTGIGLALPKLVPLLEGLAPQEAIETYLQEELTPYQGQVQAVILACTHYPLAKITVESILKVPSYDSEAPIVELFRDKVLENGPSQVMTTKDPVYMARQINVLFHQEEAVSLTEVKHADRRHQ